MDNKKVKERKIRKKK